MADCFPERLRCCSIGQVWEIVKHKAILKTGYCNIYNICIYSVYIYIYIYIYSASFLRRAIALAPIARANHPSRERFITRANYNNRSRHQTMWSHEATKNVHNANKMIDIVNYVLRIRTTYAHQMFMSR